MEQRFATFADGYRPRGHLEVLCVASIHVWLHQARDGWVQIRKVEGGKQTDDRHTAKPASTSPPVVQDQMIIGVARGRVRHLFSPSSGIAGEAHGSWAGSGPRLCTWSDPCGPSCGRTMRGERAQHRSPGWEGQGGMKRLGGSQLVQRSFANKLRHVCCRPPSELERWTGEKGRSFHANADITCLMHPPCRVAPGGSPTMLSYLPRS